MLKKITNRRYRSEKCFHDSIFHFLAHHPFIIQVQYAIAQGISFNRTMNINPIDVLTVNVNPCDFQSVSFLKKRDSN